MQVFLAHRPALTQALQSLLQDKKQSFSSDHPWADDVFTRLTEFVPSGKLLRGLLVVAAYESFQRPNSPVQSLTEVLKVASGIELFQAGVLIHDDVIDQDRLRRGQPSFFAQYQLLAEERGYAQPVHTGNSMAICVGDICLFLASEVLAEAKVPPHILSQLQALFYREVVQVGLAEMDDVRLGLTQGEVTETEILSMYRFKTGRYSCYLPLAMGAMLAGAETAVLEHLEKLGETVGLLLQIKDDELGLFGTSSQTGKPAISDVKEGKKTLYYYHVFQVASPSERVILEQAFGNPKVTEAELNQVRQIVESTGVRALVAQKMNQLRTEAIDLANVLPVADEWRAAWLELIKFAAERQK